MARCEMTLLQPNPRSNGTFFSSLPGRVELPGIDTAFSDQHHRVVDGGKRRISLITFWSPWSLARSNTP
jgi:hypothetical protein